MGDKYLNVSGFRQMCGRAGRMGLDTKGEAILMIAAGNKTERAIAETLLTADLEPLCSSLHNASGGGLEKLLLEMVSCGKLTKEEDVLRFISCTLMVVQQREDLVDKHEIDCPSDNYMMMMLLLMMMMLMVVSANRCLYRYGAIPPMRCTSSKRSSSSRVWGTESCRRPLWE